MPKFSAEYNKIGLEIGLNLQILFDERQLIRISEANDFMTFEQIQQYQNNIDATNATNSTNSINL